MKDDGFCLAWICLALFSAAQALADLPLPKDPAWTPVRDEVYLQEVEGRVETNEPLTAAADTGRA